MAVIQFDKRITLGNIVSLGGTLVIVVASYVALTLKVDSAILITSGVPDIEDRVTAVENKAQYNFNELTSLKAEVNQQDAVQTKILLSLERIQEKLGIPPR